MFCYYISGMAAHTLFFHMPALQYTVRGMLLPKRGYCNICGTDNV